jgi:tRNA pseudouridine55 synthase
LRQSLKRWGDKIIVKMSEDGVLIIDKPPDLTSHDAVMKVKKTLSAKKVGHTGTLDPFATGVLVMGINQGTKLIPYLDKTDKAYRGVVFLGTTTDTCDSTGEVVERCDESNIDEISEEDILRVIKDFTGTIKQRPPMYSAIKVDGVRLYKLARSGVKVDVQEREVNIISLELVDYTQPRITLDITCSPGTYIRSLAVDIGKALGFPAHLETLNRTRCGNFSIEDATQLGDFAALGDKKVNDNGNRKGGASWEKVIGLREAVDDMMEVSINQEEANCVMNGAPLIVDKVNISREDREDIADDTDKIVKLVYNDKLLALARVVNRKETRKETNNVMKLNLKPFKVFH